MNKLNIKIIPTGNFRTNCYLVFDNDTKKGMVIDPGAQGDLIYSKILKHNLEIDKIVLTHGHFDHIGGTNFLIQKLDVPIFIHKDDVEMLSNSKKNGSYLMGENVSVNGNINLLKNEDNIAVGEEILFKVLHTPGHTKGSICLYSEKTLFSGDTIFKDGIGRCDLYGGDFLEIVKSIKEKIYTLNKDTLIYSGHGNKTTVENEKGKVV